MKFRFLFAVAALLIALFQSIPANADGPDGSGIDQGPNHHILGIVERHDGAHPAANPPFALGFAFRNRGGNNLAYHNGPVMRTNTVYAIYWIPQGFSVSNNYQNLINGFFANVHADNGKTSNVYYSDTQYNDTTGSIAYNSSVGGSWVDTGAFPSNGCTDSYTSVCLSDAQIQAEVNHAISVNGWTAGPTHLFFVFTPKNVGSCVQGVCSYSYFCAYHSNINTGTGNNVVLYANQPYASFVSSACDIGVHPNGDDADATINVVSHEHNEAITDEQGTAWYDSRGYENGDKCAWNFGSSLGSTAYGKYNQVIGTGKYYLQQEWSNSSSGCVLTGK